MISFLRVRRAVRAARPGLAVELRYSETESEETSGTDQSTPRIVHLCANRLLQYPFLNYPTPKQPFRIRTTLNCYTRNPCGFSSDYLFDSDPYVNQFSWKKNQTCISTSRYRKRRTDRPRGGARKKDTYPRQLTLYLHRRRGCLRFSGKEQLVTVVYLTFHHISYKTTLV